MKTITIDQFKTLVARDDWKIEQEHEVVGTDWRPVDYWVEKNQEITNISGWACKTSTLDGVSISYTESFDYDEYQPETLNTGTEGQDQVWFIDGIIVVDEDGDVVSDSDLADYIEPDFFSKIDYSVLEIEQTTEIDIDEDSDMETFEIEIDNEPNLRFTGERIGHASSTDEKAIDSSWSGETGRWTVLNLYKTKGGKYICHQIGRTRWQGERDRFSGKVCESLAEVREFFGHRWLAKDLYADAGIDDSVEVE